jgi:hypothetical protein
MHVEKNDTLMLPDENIMIKIYLIRGNKLMIYKDLAELYGVETKVLKQQVKRNTERFQGDFMFELTKGEFTNLRSQIVTSSLAEFPSQCNCSILRTYNILFVLLVMVILNF